jgi:hypothetical protein
LPDRRLLSRHLTGQVGTVRDEIITVLNRVGKKATTTKNNCHSKILCSAKLSFRNEGEIKTFPTNKS